MRAVGELVAGKYRVERQLGEGGMGVVFAATHLDLHEQVAIKFVRAADLDANALARFEREARVAVKLRGEHVARILDAGRDEAGDPFIVMEYLEGTDLSQLVRTNGALSVAAAADYLVQACHGLAEAHALGIVHRDVKPANLFLARDAAGLPTVKLLDFGISRATDCGAEGITMSPDRANDFLGTPHFVSPEQLVAPQSVDARADIWSLGVTAWFLVTGEYPFPGTDLVVLLGHIMQAKDLSLVAARADIPPAFAAAIGRCMKKEREARFDDVGEMARALQPFVTGRTAALVEHTRLLVERGRLRIGEATPSTGAHDPDATRAQGRGSRPAPPAPPAERALSERDPHASTQYAPPSTLPLLPVAAVASRDTALSGTPNDVSFAGGMAVSQTLPLDAPRVPRSTNPPPPDKPSRTGFLVALSCGLVAVLAIGAGLGVRALGRSPSDPARTARTSAPAPPVPSDLSTGPAIGAPATGVASTPAIPSLPSPPASIASPSSSISPSVVASGRRGPGTRAPARASGEPVAPALRGLPATRD